jgi:hypothetical protein
MAFIFGAVVGGAFGWAIVARYYSKRNCSLPSLAQLGGEG